MTFKVFALRDLKSKTYAPPFYMQSTGAAVRAFGDLVNDPQSYPYKHPSDYILFEIGTWEDDTGLFQNYKEPTHLGVGSEYVASPPGKKVIEQVLVGTGVEENHAS